jgi:SNF2 family DNA or RNA helicase
LTTRSLDPGAQPTPSTAARIAHWEVDQESLRRLMEGLGNEASSGEWFLLRREFEAIALNPGFDRLITLDFNTIKELPHQIDVALRVLRRPMGGRAILADEVGLGKTIEAGIIMKELGVRGMARRVLILAPTSLVEQWQAELETKFFEQFDTPTEPEDWQRTTRAIVSYQGAIGHAPEILQHRWDLVIVDEAHNVKNHTTAVHQFLRQIERNFMLLLTATPLQNDLRELYNLVTLLRPGQLGTWSQFQKEYCKGGDPRRASNPESLREFTSQVMIRTRRSSVADVLHLPPRRTVHRPIDLTPGEAALYGDTVRFLRDLYREGFFKPSPPEEIEGQARRRLRTAKGTFVLELMRLLQRLTSSSRALADSLHSVASGDLVLPEYRQRAAELAQQARAVTDHAKLDQVSNYLADTPDRVVVFSEHLPTLNLLKHRVQEAGRPVITFTGLLSRAERSHQLTRFRAEPGSVFLTTRVGSEGLNLQFCNRIVNYEIPWNPMAIERRIGRVQRIGQEREVHILNLAAEATIEMRVLWLLDRKIRLFELEVGGLDMVLGEFGGAESLEHRLADTWLRAESDTAFERELEAIGEQIVASREAGARQAQLASEIVAEDNAERLEREFRQLSVPGRVVLGYGTCHLKLARGVEAKRHQLGLHVTEIREAAEHARHAEGAGHHPEYGLLHRIVGVTGRGREVQLLVQADRLPMTLADLSADAEAPLAVLAAP